MKIARFLLPALLCVSSLSPAAVRLEKIAEGFDRPVWAGMPKGANGVLWVMEQAGTVKLLNLKTGKVSDKPFLKINERVTRKGNEQGLLGLAFAADFKDSGRYYVYYNDLKDRTVVSRFVSKDKLTTNPDSEEILLKFDQPYRNHNGGWIDFGPDGMLYIGSGDGGSANDPKNAGQDLSTLLGKILRIDVSPAKGYKIPADNPFTKAKGAKPEIWSYGLRNPWRCSFDRKTGDLWIGDIGQNKWEEINWMPKGKGAGANYGWRLREGFIETPARKGKAIGGPKPKDNVEPVHVYDRNAGVSVTGGYVYRGPIKSMQGRYVFADYQKPHIWSFVLKDGKSADLKDHSNNWKPEGGFNLVSSFGEDNDGNLYVISLSGRLFKLVE